MKKLLLMSFVFICVGFCLVPKAKGQIVYAYGLIDVDANSRSIDGYAGTWLDYSAGIYYDPEVRGDLYRTDNNETSLDQGADLGYSNVLPAEVFLFTSNYVENKVYCVFTQHWIRPIFNAPELNLYFDPYNFSSLNNREEGPWQGSTFSHNNIRSRRIFLGWIQACDLITPPPTPTPTPPPPTPTPTPTPPPCSSDAGETCQDSATFRVYPTSIRPKSVSGENENATAEVCISPARANVEVTLKLVLRTEFKNFGGHIDSRHIGKRPLGRLSRTRGRTGSNGCFSAKYYPSHISSTVGIDAEVTRFTGSNNVFVGLDNLVGMIEQDNYRFIGTTTSHPKNHFGTVRTVTGLGRIAQDYNNEYYNGGIPPLSEKIAYNDMSLAFGGKFDLDRKWLNSSSHHEHREGINCDVRSRNIPLNRRAKLNDFFRERGSNRTKDETRSRAPHWHLRFERFLEANDSFSQMRNGIEQNPSEFVGVNSAEITPHSFVEDAWEVLDRIATQEEWEVWHNRLIEAKSQGASQFLAEIKVYERNLFSMSEYVARQRTNEEFIEDVFWSHLFRQPTQLEREYWENYLENLPPSVPRQRRRMRLLNEFENLPDFEEFVSNIVDSNDVPLPPTTP